jgi:hypothetical protein
VHYQGVKFQALPWWTRALVYALIFGILTALLEPYKPPNTPLRNGLTAGVVFFVLVAPVMGWMSRRRARKAAAAAKTNAAPVKTNSAVA